MGRAMTKVIKPKNRGARAKQKTKKPTPEEIAEIERKRLALE